MKIRMWLAAICFPAVLSSGCASITGTSNQSVSVQTREQGGGEVTNANCELTNNKGRWFVTSPGSVMIHRSNDDMQVLCNKVGFEPGRAAVVPKSKDRCSGISFLEVGLEPSLTIAMALPMSIQTSFK
jgi:hypothetical protein